MKTIIPGLPVPTPRRDAIAAGIFRHAGMVAPTAAECRGIAEEHFYDCLNLYAYHQSLLRAQAAGVDPATWMPPKTERQRMAVEREWQKAPGVLQDFECQLGYYADAFGDEAAEVLRRCVIETCASSLRPQQLELCFA